MVGYCKGSNKYFGTVESQADQLNDYEFFKKNYTS